MHPNLRNSIQFLGHLSFFMQVLNKTSHYSSWFHYLTLFFEQSFILDQFRNQVYFGQIVFHHNLQHLDNFSAVRDNIQPPWNYIFRHCFLDSVRIPKGRVIICYYLKFTSFIILWYSTSPSLCFLRRRCERLSLCVYRRTTYIMQFHC